MAALPSDPGIGILLTNVGTPAAPTPNAVRAYLKQFLSDRRVIDYPRWLWLPLLHGVILRARPRKSARLYRSIWTEEGSPLMTIMMRIASRLVDRLEAAREAPIHIEIGMRYGDPSIAHALGRLRQRQVATVVLLPLYPQYSGTTTGTTFDTVFQVLQGWPYVPNIIAISDYHDHPAYLGALEVHVRRFWKQHRQPDKLLFSFHGIPERYARRGDPYPLQCERTAEMLAERLGVEPHAWKIAYQSRFGPEPWLQPYTDETLRQLGSSGTESVHVIAPGFSADCLETLEEIQGEGHEIFREAGGGSFQYIPALNHERHHIKALAGILEGRLPQH